MPKISHVSTLAWSLVAALGTACGDDSSGSGGAGAGGETSSSSSGVTTSNGSTTTTSSGSPTSSSGGATGGGNAGGGDTGGGGAGGEQPACTADEAPGARCEELEDVGQTCQVDVAGGGCPDSTITWRCTDFEGGPFWNQSVDRNCFCSVENDEEACTALRGCVWADPPAGMCDEENSDGTPIPETGCYREDCGSPGFGFIGLVGDTCSDDLCSAFPPD